MEPVKEPSQDQRNDPNLRAEIAFYDALINVDLEGAAYYDVRVGKQVDAFAWFTDLWRCAIEVKGGQHMVKDGAWYSRETDGNFIKLETSPPEQALAGALAVRDTIKGRLEGQNVWINVILVLPDMPAEDEDIREYANDRKVKVIWGLDRLEEQLLRIIDEQPDRNPPDQLDILAELAALNRSAPPQQWLTRRAARNGPLVPKEFPGLPMRSSEPASGARVGAPAPPTYSFEIHNNGTLNIYLADSELSPFRSDVPDSGITGSESPAMNEPGPSTATSVDDGGGIDAQPHLEPDPFGEPIVEDGFDDYDPFS